MNRPTALHPVVLLGAGPGDPELLTVKAVKALRRATVVLIDDLAGDEVLRYVRRSARVVRVGKRGGRPCLPAPAAAQQATAGAAPRGAWTSTPQSFIDRLMVGEARRGERVVRVKGGDPFVFGRGGEEADALRAAGLAVEVINGLTAGITAPSAIGVPVTDRRHAPGVAFVTGHSRDGASGPDWAALARSGLTLVIYMGMARCGAIADALAAGGLAGDTPAAVVQDGGTARMRSHTTTLVRLAADVDRLGLGSPAVIVIGDVVRLAAPCVAAGVDGTGPVPAADGAARMAALAGIGDLASCVA